jgi:hypothetical protein
MKIIKKIVIGILVILVLFLILGIFVKKEYTVEREITINKPKQEVFDYIKSLKNQNEFSKWAQVDPNMKKDYTGTDGTVGFISSWDSDNEHVGKGEQEITKIDEGNRIDFDLRFLKPMHANATAYMTTDPAGESHTVVKWGFHGSMNYPMNTMLLFMNMDKMLGPDLEIGLTNLKNIQEKK